jgi:hypothetical protein
LQKPSRPKKIAVIGNSGGGKTKLSAQLGQLLNLPVTHIDSLQFTVDLQIKPYQETISELQKIHQQSEWIIDGYGPLDVLQERFKLSDRIVFVDFKLPRHFFWIIKRQITNICNPRPELPKGANELSFRHTVKLLRTAWKSHTQMRPELIRILQRSENQSKLIWIKTLSHWQQTYEQGLN